ncbi:hypothetical protein Tco_0492241 [Tanacetum coccineum]
MIAFADEGSSNSDTDKIMARMDAIAIKIDAQYKEMKSYTKCNSCGDIRSKQSELKRFFSFHKQSAPPSWSLPRNTQPNPRGCSPKPYQPPQGRNEHDLS